MYFFSHNLLLILIVTDFVEIRLGGEMMGKNAILLMASLFLCFTLGSFLIDTPTTAAKSSADFSDLKDLDAATKAKFDALISAGVFDGIAEDTFGLKDEMNRAQFAKVAAKIFELEVDTDLKTSSFSDVNADDAANGYALPYIEAVKTAGITDGFAEGQYNPAGKVTKEQLATFLVRGLDFGDQVDASTSLDDKSVSDWAKGYVALAIDKKLLSNGEDGKFGGTTNATRDLLVLGAYEAKEQYRPIGKLQVSAKQTGLKKITVSFSAKVDSAKAGLSATKGEVVQVDWNADNSAATLIFAKQLEPGDYVIEASGLNVADLNPLSATVTAMPEKIVKIEFTSTSDTIASSKAVAIPIKATNQFGEPVEDFSKFEVRSNRSVSIDPVKMAVIADTSIEEENNRVSITVSHEESGVQVNKIFTVGEMPVAHSVELYGLRDINGQEVSQVEWGKSYYVNFDAYDQYGNIMLYNPARTASLVTATSSDPFIASLGTVGAASAGDPGAFSFSVSLRSYTGISSNNVSISISANGSSRMDSISVNVAAPPPAVVVPIVIPPAPSVVAKPTADRSSGVVEAGTSVALSVATQGATIYYTTDGNTPTITSMPYTSPIPVTESMTIKAIAAKSGWTNSSIASFEYAILIELPESIASTSPLVVGQAYTGSVAASGGTGALTYTITSGQLPPGLGLNSSTGEITGNLSSSGSYNFTISATDSAITPATASMQYMVTIAPPVTVLTHLTSSPTNVMLMAFGATETLAITANFNDDTSINVTGDAQYESEDERVATVSSEGVVTAVTNGTTNIVVTYGGLSKNVPVMVTAGRQLESIYASLSSVSFAVGTTANVTVTAFFDDSAEGATAWATFEIEDPDLATVDENGYLTALKPGKTRIKVTFLSEEFITDELIIRE